MGILRVIAIVAGIGLIAWVFDAAIRNFMLPRSSRVRLTKWIGGGVARMLRMIAPPTRSYRWRDKVQAMRAPLTLVTFQAVWLFMVFAGFALRPSLFHVTHAWVALFTAAITLGAPRMASFFRATA